MTYVLASLSWACSSPADLGDACAPSAEPAGAEHAAALQALGDVAVGTLHLPWSRNEVGLAVGGLSAGLSVAFTDGDTEVERVLAECDALAGGAPRVDP